MKKIFAILTAIVCINSCEESIKDGAWDPIELDKTHVNFTSEGGQNTVSVLNYSRWWISGAYDLEKGPGDDYEYYIHPTSTDGKDAFTYDILDGGWFHVTVPDKGKSNTIIITVEPNDDAKPRQAIIQMQCWNAFTNISVAQQ